VSFAQIRRKKPIIIPGEKVNPSIGIKEFRPECEKAEKGNSEKGRAVYNTGKNVCARESKGLSCFL
jgi:hypothetical protein